MTEDSAFITVPIEENRGIGDFVSIAPECFADAEVTVICYKGQNFYRACDAQVAEFKDGGATHCVKRVNHPSKTHEDYHGRLRDDTLFDQLSDQIFSALPWGGEEYEAVAKTLALQLINEGWTK